MYVNVWHRDPHSPDSGLTHVATVYPPAHQLGFNQHPHMDALEYAFARTQNIWGSWSKGEFFEDGEANQDYSPHVSPAPLGPDGLGHRSSMVGDIFTIRDDANYIFVAEGFGFKLVSRTEFDA